MKGRTILFLITVTLVGACGSKPEQNKEEYGEPQAISEGVKVSEDLVAQGAALVKKNDCNTCHHATNQIVGPAHMEVAKKYAFTDENIKLLAERIIKGGSGVWGQVPMTPHSGLSQSDAEKMARYVLSLDGEKEPE
ncbi:MAG TPA: cytochrome C [Cytophagales bacterium]|nr:cytochrome C [Cytophagales bacterium]HCR54420.1 cytochrome C [Cytophagales bacterium]